VSLIAALALAASLGVATPGASVAMATASGVPGAPANAQAKPALDSTAVTVSWAAGAGPAATYFVVAAFTDAGAYVNDAICYVGCTSMVVPGLTPGSRYAFAIWAGNAAGGSPGAATPVITVNSGCASTAYCVSVDATRVAGPLRHAAAGLLDGTYLVNQTTVAPLRPTAWRLGILPTAGGGLDYTSYDAARQAGASTVTVLISDAWLFYSNGGCGNPSSSCGAAPPWWQPSAYSSWVSGYVRQIEASGRHPDYWDIQNEPDATVAAGGYYNSSGAASVSIANDLQQFQAAYQAIKAADPSAKVEGPSLSEFRTTPDGARLDMTSFLQYSASHGLRWDALSWHENGGYLSPDAWDVLPTVKIPADIATVRNLLAQNPSLGMPALSINEFGMSATSTVPGWYAAELATIEASSAASANRTCFYTATNPAVSSGCSAYPTTLDELLTSSGGTSADYRVLAAFGQLAGSRIVATPSDQTFGAIGAVDSGGAVRFLLGRAATCVAAVNPDCGEPASWTPAPADVAMNVKLPWSGTATVTIDRIPDVPGQNVGGPTVVSSQTVTVTRGSINLVLPSVADGEAWTVTIVPSTSPAPPTPQRLPHR
jgi:hypothetical protein